jgi:hypothetical protein
MRSIVFSIRAHKTARDARAAISGTLRAMRRIFENDRSPYRRTSLPQCGEEKYLERVMEGYPSDFRRFEWEL